MDAMFILKFDLESAYALGAGKETDENWRMWIDECIAAVTQIAKVAKRNDAPATIFVVGKVLERAGNELAALLDGPLFDIESHTYSHMHIKNDDPAVLSQLGEELEQTSNLILQYFGKRPIGFCAPGGFYQGLRGHPSQLAILSEQGYKFVSTDGEGPPEQPMPAPFVLPYWYTEEGYPDLLEIPVTGWHCNMLFNTGHQSDNWRPAPGYPDGTIMHALPATIDEGFQARRKEFQYAIDNDIIYVPAMHPWSVYRFDPELRHVESLIAMAREKEVPIVTCKQLYEEYAR